MPPRPPLPPGQTCESSPGGGSGLRSWGGAWRVCPEDGPPSNGMIGAGTCLPQGTPLRGPGRRAAWFRSDSLGM